MTTSTASSGALSEGTIECRTGAIVQREGARAVGSTFAREWDSQPAPSSVAPLPAETPSSLRALPALPSPSAPTPSPAALRVPPSTPPVAPCVRRRPSSGRSRARPVVVTWSFAGAFALGAAIAALAGVGIERGAIEVAALASAIAGGMTLSAALGRAASKGRADGGRP